MSPKLQHCCWCSSTQTWINGDSLPFDVLNIQTAFLQYIIGLALVFSLYSCTNEKQPETPSMDGPYYQVVGVAQDAGFPQAGCQKDCCREVWKNPDKRRMVSCIGFALPETGEYWLMDATPDLKDQMHAMEERLPNGKLAGIFLTHAHIGHYTGLMEFGREVMGASKVPVYAMPRMADFLRNNGPWSQLVSLEQIEIRELNPEKAVQLPGGFQVESLPVPHRDEFSETVGFRVTGPQHSLLFIPDIDKWEKWGRDITQLIQQTDLAFLDGTFYRNGELPGRDMSQIPHPFIEESLSRFASLNAEQKSNVHFIHFNHTNPLLDPTHPVQKEFAASGFKIAQEGQMGPL